jgi:hypothetical protein
MDSVDESIDGLGVYICPCYLLIGNATFWCANLPPEPAVTDSRRSFSDRLGARRLGSRCHPTSRVLHCT